MTVDMTLGYLTLAAPPLETIRAAADAGFTSCGVRLTPRSVEGRDAAADIAAADPGALAAAARDAGVAISNVTCYQINPHLDDDAMKCVVDATARAGAPVLVVNAFDIAPDHARDRYAEFCAIAEPAGIRLAFEFIPYSAVRDLPSALACLEHAGSVAACLTLDLLHLCRAGDDLAALDTISSKDVGLAQICDAPPAPPAGDGALRSEAREGRLELGQGGLPIVEFFHRVRALADVEYEIPARAHAALTPARKAAAARRDIDAFFLNLQSFTEGR